MVVWLIAEQSLVFWSRKKIVWKSHLSTETSKEQHSLVEVHYGALPLCRLWIVYTDHPRMSKTWSDSSVPLFPRIFFPVRRALFGKFRSVRELTFLDLVDVFEILAIIIEQKKEKNITCENSKK
jgi:hypothetical protein